MTEFLIVHDFQHGEWTYRSGEEFTEADLEARGMDADGIARAFRIGGMEKREVVAAVPETLPPGPDAD